MRGTIPLRPISCVVLLCEMRDFVTCGRRPFISMDHDGLVGMVKHGGDTHDWCCAEGLRVLTSGQMT